MRVPELIGVVTTQETKQIDESTLEISETAAQAKGFTVSRRARVDKKGTLIALIVSLKSISDDWYEYYLKDAANG
jgi:hypothetical protein